MPDNETTVTFKVDLEGIGDAEECTIDREVADAIAELVRQNLRNRYTHIGQDQEIDVAYISGGNTVGVHFSETDE